MGCGTSAPAEERGHQPPNNRTNNNNNNNTITAHTTTTEHATHTNDNDAAPQPVLPENGTHTTGLRTYDFTWTEDDELIIFNDSSLVVVPHAEGEENREPTPPPPPADENKPYVIPHVPTGCADPSPADNDGTDSVDGECVDPHFDAECDHLKGLLKTVITVPRNPEYVKPEKEQPVVDPGKKWVDKSFLKDIAMKNCSLDSDWSWKRPSDFMKKEVKLFNGVTDRHDIHQGQAGTCFFLSVVAAIADKEDLMKQIFPDDAYNPETGVFHCRLWRFGKFQDVYIDDFIPVYYDDPWGASCKNGELWVTLLEKAFVRLHGGYGNCDGGQIGHAFCTLTGGVSELYKMADTGVKEQVALWKRLSNAISSSAVVAASVPAGDSETVQGLVTQHAFSLTGSAEVKVVKKRVRLLRIRNPWGNTEWTGPWSDRSSKWSLIDKDVRSKLLVVRDDGEFWMDMDSFCKRFQSATICNISPDVDDDGESDELEHVTCMYGEWKGDTASSGWRNKLDNPLFKVEVNGSSEKVPVVFEVCQRTRKKTANAYKAIAMKVWRMKESGSNCVLEELPKASDDVFRALPSVCFRSQVAPGSYLIAPLTYEKGIEMEFLIRVYTKERGDGCAFDKGSVTMFTHKPETSFTHSGKDYSPGHEQVMSGKWVAGVNAGGFPTDEQGYINPQFFLTVPPGKSQPLTVSLLQANIPKMKCIGVRLYVYKESAPLPIDKNFMDWNWEHCPKTIDGTTDRYILEAESVTTHYLLPGGQQYIAMPTTSNPGDENKFVLILQSDDDLNIQPYNMA